LRRYSEYDSIECFDGTYLHVIEWAKVGNTFSILLSCKAPNGNEILYIANKEGYSVEHGGDGIRLFYNIKDGSYQSLDPKTDTKTEIDIDQFKKYLADIGGDAGYPDTGVWDYIKQRESLLPGYKNIHGERWTDFTHYVCACFTVK
jgi:hypothetical protein